jgi:hypothetical protein
MYDLLCRALPPKLAAAVLVLWYVALILALLWCWNASPSDFRYGAI